MYVMNVSAGISNDNLRFQEITSEEECFTPSDVERALWSSAIRAKLSAKESDPSKISKRKREIIGSMNVFMQVML